MALVLADRVKETTTTTGTATYTLSGAETGFESFGAIGDGNQTYYCCTDGTDFEVGIGTYTASGTTLARTVILQSSNSDSAVSWSSGSKNIFCTQPAEKAVFLDASGHIIASDGRNLTNVDAATLDSLDSTQFLRSDQSDTMTGDLTLTATDDSSNSTPELKLVRHSASPADFDYIGGLSFFADNSADQNIEFGTLEARIRDVTDGTEDFAGFELFGIKEGTARQRFMILGQSIFHLMNQQLIRFDNITGTHDLDISPPSSLSTSQTITLPDATGTVSLLTNTETLTNKTLTNPTINAFSGTGDASITGDLTLVSTDAGDTAQPTLSLYRNSASPAFVDNLGQIQFFGENDADEKVEYARIDAVVITVTDGSEAGQLDFAVAESGSTPTYLRMVAGKNQFFKSIYLGATYNLVFEGSAYNDHETTLTVTNPTADRTITLPDASGTVLLNTGDQSITGDLTLTSTDAGATENPTLDLFRNSASPAVNDVIGHITFSGENDASQKTTYAEIETIITDETDGTEDSSVKFNAIRGGSSTTYYQIGFGVNQFHKDVLIESNDAGATENPTLDLYRNSASPANDDIMGEIVFSGENDAGEKITYSSIRSHPSSVADGAESDRLVFRAIRNGTLLTYMEMKFDLIQFNRDIFLNSGQTIMFEGATSDNNETTLTATDPTADRTITLPDATGTVALNESGILNLTNSGSQSELRLYCESANAHYAALKAPAHSAFSGNVDITLPATAGTLALTSGDITGNAATATTATNADTVDNKHIAVVSALPSSPDSNTIYFIT